PNIFVNHSRSPSPFWHRGFQRTMSLTKTCQTPRLGGSMAPRWPTSDLAHEAILMNHYGHFRQSPRCDLAEGLYKKGRLYKTGGSCTSDRYAEQHKALGLGEITR